MAFHSSELKSTEINPVHTGPLLPWWTWVLPFLIAHAGTRLSLWFKTDPGTALWYLPTALGIVMVYWWGPRVLIGIYLNAVVSAPLWDLPWQGPFLYALPETLEVGLSWLFFIKFARGKYWLPDLRNVSIFLLFGSLAPTFLASTYLATQLQRLGDIARNTLWDNWRVLFSADLAAQSVLTVPMLLFLSPYMHRLGWTLKKESMPQLPFLVNHRDSRRDILFITAVFITALILVTQPLTRDLWILDGLLMIVIAIRYGVNMAVLGTSWIGIPAYLLPIILTGQRGLPSANYEDIISTNFNILFLCAVTLITGRAISDLFTEIDNHKRSEKLLLGAEVRYRSLVEQIPPIIYTAGRDQHIGVSYISPQIKLLGFTQAEWIADPELWLRQIHPDDQKSVLADIERSKVGDQPFKSEYRIQTRAGQTRWFIDEATNVLNSDGELLFRQGFMLDITARKLAEESLSSREQYLELLNNMTRATLLSRDFDSTLHTLAIDMARLLNADDCYITHWDAERQWTIPAVTTAKLKKPYAAPGDLITSAETDMTTSALKAGRVLAAEDVFNSPYISAEIAQRYPARSALGVPLIVGEHKLGAAIIAYNTPHHFTADEIERAEQAGNQVALALWNFQQAVEIQQRLKEGGALAEISRALSESERIGTGEVSQLIVDATRELIPHAEQSVIHLLNADEQVLFAWAVSGYSSKEKENSRVKMRLGEGVAGSVIREGITINVGDIETSPHFISNASTPTFRSLLVAPVQSGGQQIGTISVQSAAPNAFSTKDAGLLNSLAVQAAIAIENTRLLETTQQKLKEVNALYQISRRLAISLDAEQLIRDMVGLLQESFGYYHVQIYLIDLETGNLVIRHGSGSIGQELIQKGHSLPAGEGIVGHVAETGQPFFTNTVDAVVFFKRNPLLPQTQSEIAVPIKVDNKVVGVLDIQTTSQQRLLEGDLQLMVAVADQLAVALQKANLYTDLQTALQQEQTVRSQLIQSERLALVGQLLASVSHELNNPLQAIQNALFLLKEEENLSDQARQDLDVILAEAERMAALIERLRSAYRPVRIKDFQPVDLNGLIEDVHMLITTHMRQKTIAFEFFPDPDLPKVSGLPDQIRQVVLNLFLNAVEVLKPGGRLMVQTCGLPLQNEVLLIVKDSGPGIDPEILPRIFEPFITSKHTGTGLGLTITHDIIEQHHGRMEAKNDPQGGAVFNIWLPTDTRG